MNFEVHANYGCWRDLKNDLWKCKSHDARVRTLAWLKFSKTKAGFVSVVWMSYSQFMLLYLHKGFVLCDACAWNIPWFSCNIPVPHTHVLLRLSDMLHSWFLWKTNLAIFLALQLSQIVSFKSQSSIAHSNILHIPVEKSHFKRDLEQPKIIGKCTWRWCTLWG